MSYYEKKFLEYAGSLFKTHSYKGNLYKHRFSENQVSGDVFSGILTLRNLIELEWNW